MHSLNHQNSIKNELKEHNDTINLLNSIVPEIENFSKLIINTLKRNNKLIICGNGGSAADAQHFSSELVGKYEKFRKSLPAISLSTDCSAITAIGNDFGFQDIFSRQLEGLAQKGDLLLLISTSGNSINLLNALKISEKKGMNSIALLGRDGGAIKELVNYEITISSKKTCRIQEAHGLIIHIICKLIDETF